MYINILTGLLLCVLLFGCKENTNTLTENRGGKYSKEGSFKKELSSGDLIFQIEYNERLDTSYFDVLLKGERISRNAYKGRITNEFLTDLNKDRRNEIYLVVEHGNVAQIYGFRFNDGQFTSIKKSPRRKDLPTTNSSQISLERNQLIERFTYLAEDGSIAYAESRYNLVERDNDWLLLPQGWQSSEIEDLIGEYKTKDDQNTDHYKVLLIGEREGGIWNVDISVKRKKDKEVLCHFSGLGEFVDKDLFVPLSQANPEMKGTLQIRFVDGSAIIYTEDFDDYMEMAMPCSNGISIAGNFRKIQIDE